MCGAGKPIHVCLRDGNAQAFIQTLHHANRCANKIARMLSDTLMK